MHNNANTVALNALPPSSPAGNAVYIPVKVMTNKADEATPLLQLGSKGEPLSLFHNICISFYPCRQLVLLFVVRLSRHLVFNCVLLILLFSYGVVVCVLLRFFYVCFY
jgi:hypothetical protein